MSLDALEEVLAKIPADAAKWVRKHQAALSKIPGQTLERVFQGIANGKTTEAEAALYEQLDPAQRERYLNESLESLKDAVDARLAATAAIYDAIDMLSTTAAAALAGVGGALTAGLAQLADEIADALEEQAE